MYPALISRDAVSLRPTRSENVAEMLGLTCAGSLGAAEEEVPLWYESDTRYTSLRPVVVQPASRIAGDGKEVY
jgi:hypothetical protein